MLCGSRSRSSSAARPSLSLPSFDRSGPGGVRVRLLAFKDRSPLGDKAIRLVRDSGEATEVATAADGVAVFSGVDGSELGRFLDDARVPIDNNASERSLRRVALGRKNFLFVGDVVAGSSIAGLYTLVATCEARGINPFAYLADVIPRVQDHPKRRLDELLPGAWVRAQAAA